MTDQRENEKRWKREVLSASAPAPSRQKFHPPFFPRDRAKFVGTRDRQGAKFVGRLKFVREQATVRRQPHRPLAMSQQSTKISLRPWRPTHTWVSSHFISSQWWAPTSHKNEPQQWERKRDEWVGVGGEGVVEGSISTNNNTSLICNRRW